LGRRGGCCGQCQGKVSAGHAHLQDTMPAVEIWIHVISFWLL
jgi:hypothetical protein